jgi:hypothetical protein
MTNSPTAHKRRFPWGLCALLGAVGWVVLMFAIGSPIYAFLAPAFGPIGGWIVGGIVYLALSPFRIGRGG